MRTKLAAGSVGSSDAATNLQEATPGSEAEGSTSGIWSRSETLDAAASVRPTRARALRSGPACPRRAPRSDDRPGSGNHGVMVAPTRRPSWNEGNPPGPEGKSETRRGCPGRAGLRAGDGATPRRRRERRWLSRTRLSPKSLDVLPGQRPRRGLGAVGYEDRDREDEGGCGEHGRGVRGRSPRRLRQMRAPRRASSTAPTRASRTAGRTKARPRNWSDRSIPSVQSRLRRSSRLHGLRATRARRRPSRSRPARGTVVPASRGRARSRPAYGTSPPRPPLPRRRPAHRSATPTCSAWRPEAARARATRREGRAARAVPLRRRRT